MGVIGISAYYHDSAAALIQDGRVIAAVQEERFSRIKNDPSFPKTALKYCFNTAARAGININNVVFYEKPIRKLDRVIDTILTNVPCGLQSFGSIVEAWSSGKLNLKSRIRQELAEISLEHSRNDNLLFSEHHLSHAASAFYPSPFSQSAILTVDGVGEWATTTYGIGHNANIDLVQEIRFPSSLGLLYSSFTQYLGFEVNSGEYKVMGLAPFGKPRFFDLILSNLIDLRDDGSFELNQKYFTYCTHLSMIRTKFENLFDMPARRREDLLTTKHFDIAASIQAVLNFTMVRMARFLRQNTGEKNLCMAGGVALNCVTNSQILRESGFENVWIQPAAGDAGGAVGAALAVSHMMLAEPRSLDSQRRDGMLGSFLGPEFGEAEIRSALDQESAEYEHFADDELYNIAAKALADGNILGWFQGRMEFGPRALGARSILGDARKSSTLSRINSVIKCREGFRPLAPAILSEDAKFWFNMQSDNPYMLFVAEVARSQRVHLSDEQARFTGLDRVGLIRSTIPAATHVDNTSRFQTVNRETNARFYRLITKFKDITGCPVVINTSFNLQDEPIVCTPSDAYRSFKQSELDILIISNFVLRKSNRSR